MIPQVMSEKRVSDAAGVIVRTYFTAKLDNSAFAWVEEETVRRTKFGLCPVYSTGNGAESRHGRSAAYAPAYGARAGVNRS